jgi:dihydrofolate reductase
VQALTYFIALSIDGFIAGPDDEVDFFEGSDEYMKWMADEYADALPSHAREQLGLADAPLARFDTVVMGRRTYEPALAAGILSPYSHLRQFVISTSLEESHPRVSVIRHNPLEAVRELKRRESDLGIYLAGGGRLAGELLAEIDRLVVKRYPVVAGDGIPAFGAHFNPTAFELESVQSFDGGNIVETYTR